MMHILEVSQRDLRESEERFRALTETASDAIVSTDSTGAIIYWNKAAEDVFGFTAKEITGKEIDMIVAGQSAEPSEKGIARYLEEGKPTPMGHPVELTGIRKDELRDKATIHKEYDKLPQTFCNPQELNQVFLHLLVNASHAIGDKGNITLQTREEQGIISITITDNGMGISPEIIEHIFEPFFTTKPVGKGTGLGLSLCYDIVKKHDGDITVASEPGKGTTFKITLPVKKEAAGSANTSAA